VGDGQCAVVPGVPPQCSSHPGFVCHVTPLLGVATTLAETAASTPVTAAKEIPTRHGPRRRGSARRDHHETDLEGLREGSSRVGGLPATDEVELRGESVENLPRGLGPLLRPSSWRRPVRAILSATTRAATPAATDRVPIRADRPRDPPRRHPSDDPSELPNHLPRPPRFPLRSFPPTPSGSTGGRSCPGSRATSRSTARDAWPC
jgi:hypothetical protein